MKIKKSTVEELVKRMVALRDASPDNEEEFSAAYDLARDLDKTFGFPYTGVWELMCASEAFDRLNVETVTTLFEALGVEVCDE
jgi:hypothetical protein